MNQARRIRQQGAVIVAIVVMLLVFTAGVAALGVLTTTGGVSAANQRQSVQALYWAEWGVEWLARQAADTDGDACPDPTSLDEPPPQFTIAQLGDPEECRYVVRGYEPNHQDVLAERALVITLNRGGPPPGGPPGGGPPGGGPPPGVNPPACERSGNRPPWCDDIEDIGDVPSNQPALTWQEGSD